MRRTKECEEGGEQDRIKRMQPRKGHRYSSKSPFTHPKSRAAELVHRLILHADTFNRPANLFLVLSRFAPAASALRLAVHHTRTLTTSLDRRSTTDPSKENVIFRPSRPHFLRRAAVSDSCDCGAHGRALC